MSSETPVAPPTTAPPRARVMFDRRGRVYEPTVGTKLRGVLIFIFLLFALLGANGAYLASLKLANWWTGREYRISASWFYYQMILWHLALGWVLVVPFVLFVGLHLRKALGRANRRAVKLGLALLIVSILLIVSGILADMRQLFPTTSFRGQLVYWVHVLTPIAVIAIYIAHRRAGPRIQWRYAKAWGIAVLLLIGGFGILHWQNPARWGVEGAGEQYFFPSSFRTGGQDGDTPLIPEKTLMANDYCMRCHQDAYAGWFHSAHHFASFNNLAYRQSILDMRQALDREAREEAKRDGMKEDTDEFAKFRAKKLQATRWCAGCHDPVPFASGRFNSDEFFENLKVEIPRDGSPWKDPSIEKEPTAHAGITCVSCHAITHINPRGPIGNANYTITNPELPPFALSEHQWLRDISDHIVKSNPDLHKKTYLKPFHRTSDFCSTCHKVHLPEPVNAYKWIRGQNHWDSWHNSGASGFAARSFYHPPNAKKCSDCHMPMMDSSDFGNINGQIHNHLFLGANTALPAMRKYFGERNHLPPIGDEDDVIRHHQAFLRDKKLRVDLFAVREGGRVDGRLHAIRPEFPKLVPGETYLLEVVVRNLGVGHEFTQGTTDSNEVWAHIQVSTEGNVWAESGAMDRYGYVDAWSHFLNAVVLDRYGGRIERRNAKDIFVPLFSHQIPPSSSQVIHYRLQVPKEQRGPVDVKVQIKYRKFDRIFQDSFMGRSRRAQAASLFAMTPGNLDSWAGALAMAATYETHRGPELPVTVITEDQVRLPIAGTDQAGSAAGERPPPWERFNDYGIGLLLQEEGGSGPRRLAEEVFHEVTRLKPDYADGYLNLARVYFREGQLREMAGALERAKEVQPGYFKTAWLRGELHFQQGYLDEAIDDFRRVLSTKIPERGFDFSKDREIRRRLAETLFQVAQGEDPGSPKQVESLREAVAEFKEVLAIDPEDRLAHFMLNKCYDLLGERTTAAEHLAAYKIYEIDNSARDLAVQKFRLDHPWADHAAQAVVIYDLQRQPRVGPPRP